MHIFAHDRRYGNVLSFETTLFSLDKVPRIFAMANEMQT